VEWSGVPSKNTHISVALMMLNPTFIGLSYRANTTLRSQFVILDTIRVNKKVNFVIYIVDRKDPTCIQAKLVLLGCVNPAALPLVEQLAEWTTTVNELNRPVGTSPVISACWRMMYYDVKISGARIRTHDLSIDRKQVCYPLHHSAQQCRTFPITRNVKIAQTMSEREADRSKSRVECTII